MLENRKGSCVIAAQTGISGSTVIEDHAIIGGQVGFGDHARVESGAIIGSKAGVLPERSFAGEKSTGEFQCAHFGDTRN
jgi:UDP-3-O-[3-hydroxymyristoyl] glucosamine N-acyltransferase